jgi:Txe/YoeB family toxin of Txe-Axe toxin-antitoxin module
MMPDVVIPDSFTALCEKKKKKCDTYIIDKLRNAIVEISSSENPEGFGEKKKGDLKEYYSYRLTRGHRVLYTVERKKRSLTITFERVCDHKSVYNRG